MKLTLKQKIEYYQWLMKIRSMEVSELLEEYIHCENQYTFGSHWDIALNEKKMNFVLRLLRLRINVLERRKP
jgi:hypothetical protein